MGYMLRQRLTTVGALAAIPTWRYKLPSVGKYTAIEVVVDCRRFATRADIDLVYPLEQMVSKIELVEGGSRALLSLPGTQLDALNYWSFGRPNARRYRQEAATGNISRFFVLGGRNLYDRQYGYDFGRLNETYLEYSHSIDADAAEKFDASHQTVTLYGWRWMGDDVPTFQGLMRARQIASWTTTGADVLKTIPIPIGTPIRRFGIQAKTRAKTLGGTFTKAEVIVNNGEYSPATITSPMAWTMQEAADYDLNNEMGGVDYLVGTGTVEVPRWWSYYNTLLCCPFGLFSETNPGTNMITLPAGVRAHTTGNEEVVFTGRGWGFQKCLRIGFDHDDNGADLLQTRGMGSLDVQLTEAAADLECAVFFEDILAY